MNPTRFPDSEISGSKPVIGYPKLIADYHVLHRHLTPRHPPYALRSLTTFLSASEHSSSRICSITLSVASASDATAFDAYSVIKDRLGS
jgi:hypothetical protein